MELFNQTFGFIAAICLGVIILTVFFQGVGYLRRVTGSGQVLKPKGFIEDGKWVNVHLGARKSVLGVRFVGFTDPADGKVRVPYPLSSMVVLETKGGARILIRADSVRMIEEIEDLPPNA